MKNENTHLNMVLSTEENRNLMEKNKCFFISFLIQKKIPNLMKRKKNSLSNLVYVFDNVMIHTKFLFTNTICIH